MDFFFYLSLRRKKMTEQLRASSLRLVDIDEALATLNAQRKTLLETKHEIEREIVTIVSQPDYNTIHQLSLANGRTIRIIREHTKPWGISKAFLRDIIHEYFNTTRTTPPEASELIDLIYRRVYRENHSTSMKIELR